LAAESEFGVLFLLLSVFFKIVTILYIFFSKYAISQIFLLTYITTFEPEIPAGHPKYQKDSDCSLVSSKNFREILPPNGWCPGPGKVGQGGLKVLHL